MSKTVFVDDESPHDSVVINGVIETTAMKHGHVIKDLDADMLMGFAYQRGSGVVSVSNDMSPHPWRVWCYDFNIENNIVYARRVDWDGIVIVLWVKNGADLISGYQHWKMINGGVVRWPLAWPKKDTDKCNAVQDIIYYLDSNDVDIETVCSIAVLLGLDKHYFPIRTWDYVERYGLFEKH